MGAQHHSPAALLLWKSLGTLVQKDGFAEQVTVQPVATPTDHTNATACSAAAQEPTVSALRLVFAAVNVLSEDTEKTAKLSEVLS
jgi:hypothetical protein